MSDERQEWMDDPRGPVLLPLNGLHDHPYGEVANQHPPEEPPPTIDIRPREPRPDFLGPILDEGCRVPAQALADQLDLDLLLWGNAYVVDGKRVDPTTVTVHRRTPQGEAERVHPKIHSQEEFLTALDILLDHTLHADECYIDDAQTECVCVIGKVRAAMPPCGAVRPRPFEDQRLTQPRKYWTCTRNAHPASPDRHVFG